MNPHTLIIEPGLADRHYWRDLGRCCGLFYVLAWRDIAVRYKQTLIGLAWALVRPLLTMIVFFPRLRHPRQDAHRGHRVLCTPGFYGLLLWQFFAIALTKSSNSMIGITKLSSKVCFPRLIPNP